MVKQDTFVVEVSSFPSYSNTRAAPQRDPKGLSGRRTTEKIEQMWPC